mmetsp:Transcript_40828/g.108204  ORF Transcript_40828/g.108204 Transcript_40828/m.108204 type:complete len:232 (+) Transcript_40828:309-1004(+)
MTRSSGTTWGVGDHSGKSTEVIRTPTPRRDSGTSQVSKCSRRTAKDSCTLLTRCTAISSAGSCVVRSKTARTLSGSRSSAGTTTSLGFSISAFCALRRRWCLKYSSFRSVDNCSSHACRCCSTNPFVGSGAAGAMSATESCGTFDTCRAAGTASVRDVLRRLPLRPRRALLGLGSGNKFFEMLSRACRSRAASSSSHLSCLKCRRLTPDPQLLSPVSTTTRVTLREPTCQH